MDEFFVYFYKTFVATANAFVTTRECSLNEDFCLYEACM
jgi:hypothetical protein